MLKGFTLPILILIVAILASLPFAFLYFTTEKADSNDVAVMGTSTEGTEIAKIEVQSNAPIWELNKYLCKTLEECEESLESGKKLGVFNGTKETSEVRIVSTDDWNNYEYVKILVRQPLTLGASNVFTVSPASGSTVNTLTIDENDVAIINISEASENSQVVTFVGR